MSGKQKLFFDILRSDHFLVLWHRLEVLAGQQDQLMRREQECKGWHPIPEGLLGQPG